MMTKEEVIELWHKEGTEYLEFNRIKEKFSQRKDLHAFILLDRIFGETTNDIISVAEHDQIFLSVRIDSLGKVATREQIIDLIRCGCHIDEHGEYDENLYMFV